MITRVNFGFILRKRRGEGGFKNAKTSPDRIGYDVYYTPTVLPSYLWGRRANVSFLPLWTGLCEGLDTGNEEE